MGFIKFTRVFRFISFFVGLSTLLYGVLLYALMKAATMEELTEIIEAAGMTLEEYEIYMSGVVITSLVLGGV